MRIAILLILFSLSLKISSQTLRVYLDSYTTLDDKSVHLEVLNDKPLELINAPPYITGENYASNKYLNLFYSWDSDNDENITLMVQQMDDADILYIDRNNDEDLSNDGDPVLFPLSQDSVSFNIVSQKDEQQAVKLSIWRKPNVADTIVYKYVDDSGNLNNEFLKIHKSFSGDFNYDGSARSFYFDYRHTVRRGEMTVAGNDITIALFDESNNGLYNDDRDLLLIDWNNDKILDGYTPSETYSINDIFKIGSKNYEIIHIEKYGSYFDLEETKESPTFKHLRRTQEQTMTTKDISLDSLFWQINLTTLNGDRINTSSLAGKYIFLNFWGEWCPPCFTEIPEIVLGHSLYNSEVEIISVLNSKNIEKAKQIIERESMKWTHILIHDDLKELFKIYSYPSNILISPNGKTFLKTGGINRTFFDIYLK